MKNYQAIVPEDLDELIHCGFSEEQLSAVSSFLEPLCLTARLYATRIFIRAKLRKKAFDAVMSALKMEWDEVWRHGTEGRLGDPDDVSSDGIGMRNTVAFYEAYKSLGLGSPKFLF